MTGWFENLDSMSRDRHRPYTDLPPVVVKRPKVLAVVSYGHLRETQMPALGGQDEEEPSGAGARHQRRGRR